MGRGRGPGRHLGRAKGTGRVRDDGRYPSRLEGLGGCSLKRRSGWSRQFLFFGSREQSPVDEIDGTDERISLDNLTACKATRQVKTNQSRQHRRREPSFDRRLTIRRSLEKVQLAPLELNPVWLPMPPQILPLRL
jgi:hypothetical protein